MCSKRRNKIWYFLISICLLMSSVPVNPAWGTEQENKAVMDLPANELENAVQNADLSEPILSQEELTLLVTSNQKFSTLKENEKEQLLDEYLVSSAKMELCETAGYTTQDSIELSRIFQNIDMTPEQFEEMAENFGDREWAMEEAKAYANYRYTHASIKMGADPICIGYLISGIPAGEILKARAMAYFLDLEIQDTNTFAEPNIEYAEDDMIGQIAGLFHTKKELLEAYATANELSVDEISDIVMEEIGSVLQEAGGPMPMASGGADYAYDPETHPLAPFAYDRAGTERINEQTGSVGYVETDAVLPGKNGLDLTIGVRYDSGNSSNAIPSTVSSSFGSYNKISNYAKLKYMYSPMNSFSPGWDFTNSYIRYYINGFRNIYSAIVPPAGMTRSIALKDVENKNKTEISLDNGRIKIYDMRLYKDSSYEDNGVTSMFCAKYMDGRKEYFDDQGKLMKTENRFGDQILYRYSATGTEIADFQQNYNKVEITDTRGQITTIEKKAVETHQDAEGKDIHTQAMVITFPDQSTVTYNLRNTLHPYPNKEITQVVDSKTNQEGMTTYFEYIEDDRSKFNFMGAFATYGDHTFYPMTKIVHPTGLVTEYTYEHFNGTGGSTIRSYEYYRVLERKDTDGTNDYNVETYTYYGDYTSWAKEHETSKVSVTNEDGLTVERGFKKYLIGGNALQFYRLKEYERSYYKDGENEINVSRTDYGKYFERSYPLSITKRVFSEDGTRSIDTTENYEYDEYGNRIKYWDPRANGDTNDTEHLTTYAYDSEYHYLTESAYKRDADTTIREVNTPSEDHKNIIEQSTYMNGALAAKSSFSYDENSGKPKSTTIYRSTASGDSVTTSCEYQDNTFKTKETTNGNTTEYTYDVFGRVLSQKDPKGNITAFAYDKLGRQTHVSYPDQTSTSAVYQLKDISGNVINRVTTTAQNGSQTEYNYDLFGREAIIKDLTLNVTQEIHEYDSMGRIKK